MTSVADSRTRLRENQTECLADLQDDHDQTIATLQDPVLSDLSAAWEIVSAREAAANAWVAEGLRDMSMFSGRSSARSP